MLLPRLAFWGLPGTVFTSPGISQAKLRRSEDWWAGEDLNLHAPKSTAPLTLRVYHSTTCPLKLAPLILSILYLVSSIQCEKSPISNYRLTNYLLPKL